MVYALKTQRITTRKLAKDRFLTCQIHSSSEEKEGYAGCLFSLIEIDSKQLSVSQIGHSIINTTAREYFRGQSDEAQDNFELALKKTNDILANYTQEGQTDWIGNLNGLIALIYKDEVHLTCVGNVYALLIREGKLINITPENQDTSDVHPLCTFSNITSGPLEKNDVILIANKNIFDHIDKKELRQLIEINPLEESTIELAHLLSEEKNFDTNVILIETTTKEDIANEPLSSIPESIYLDEINDSLLRKFRSFSNKSLKPALSKTYSGSKKTAQKIYHWTKGKNIPQKLSPILPALKNLSQKIPKKSKINFEEPTEHVKIHRYNQHHFSFKWKSIPLYPAIITLLTIILIASLIIKIIANRPKTKPASTSKTTANSIDLSSLQTKYSLSKSATTKEAISLLQQILDQLSGSKLTAQQKELLTQTQARYSTLTSSTFITTPTNHFSLPNNNIQFSIFENIIYAFSKTAVYRGQINQTKLNQTQKLTASQGNIIAISGPSSNKSFYIYTSASKIFEYNPTQNLFNELKSTEPWKPAISINSFNTNLYLLDTQNNQIWKYMPGKNNTYNQAAPYLKTVNTQVSMLTNLSIDSNLYSITKNGQIYKITKTSLTPISISRLPSDSLSVKNPISLIANADANNFFIVEPNRIILTDKQGKYLKQFIYNDRPIKNIFVQTTLKKIWIATDQTLFSISY